MKIWSLSHFWGGIFLGALIGFVALAPESNLSNKVRNLFYTMQDASMAILNAVLDHPIITNVILALVLIIMNIISEFFKSSLSKSLTVFAKNNTKSTTLKKLF